MPGRFIGDSVSFLRDWAHYASTSGSSVAILSPDQEKAFDRVDFVLLSSALGRMGFGPSFISWTDLFYSWVQSAIEVNGYITPFFGLSCSVWQGCPISPLLYVLYALAEVLACNIRANPAIIGLSLPGAPFLWPLSFSVRTTHLLLLRLMLLSELLLRPTAFLNGALSPS